MMPARLVRPTGFLFFGATPIIFTLVTDYSSYLLVWNQGRGGFLFALAFLLVEFWDARHTLNNHLSGGRAWVAAVLLAGVVAYFASVVFLGAQQLFRAFAPLFNIQLVYSWIWVWDYAVFLIYVTALATVWFGLRALRLLPSPLIYLFGMTIILSLDAFFPYDSLGPLQAVVPIILTIDVTLLRLLQLGQATVFGNVLSLQGQHGPFTLAVFWPSAGVHSMIIYSLIMLALLVKLDLPLARKALYFAIGAAGTFLVNVFRIFLLSAYVLVVTTDVARFEEFHAVAGEILFLPWVALYVLGITWWEGRRRFRMPVPSSHP